jgi:hypothetical protein
LSGLGEDGFFSILLKQLRVAAHPIRVRVAWGDQMKLLADPRKVG